MKLKTKTSLFLYSYFRYCDAF